MYQRQRVKHLLQETRAGAVPRGGKRSQFELVGFLYSHTTVPLRMNSGTLQDELWMACRPVH